MNYTKVIFTLNPYHSDASDLLMALLGEINYESFIETESGVEAYIPSKDFIETEINTIEIPFNHTTFTYQIEEIPDQNWNEVWEKNYFQPIIIDNKCIIRGPFHEAQPHIPYQIVIEPKMAFGTGHHETTGRMISFILEITMQNKTVLDMGCGTGILGMLASMLGAKEVVGIDIDEWSTNNTIENCTLNNIHNMSALLGDASLLTTPIKYDIVIANINRNILLEDLKHYSKVIKPGGTLLLSGFYHSDLEIINSEANIQGFKFLSVKEQNNWVASAYTKN